jgi:hypothetical protein
LCNFCKEQDDKDKKIIVGGKKKEFEFQFWCLTPLSAIFQLYHGDQF